MVVFVYKSIIELILLIISVSEGSDKFNQGELCGGINLPTKVVSICLLVFA